MTEKSDKMKINSNMLTKVYIWLIIIISSSFFGFYNVLPKVIDAYFTDAIALLLILISLFFSLIYFIADKFRFSKNSIIDLFAWSFGIYVIVEVLISHFKYSSSQDFTMTIKEAIVFIAPIIVYLQLRKNINNKECLDYLISVMIKVSLICSIVAIMAFLLYQNAGLNILKQDVNGASFIRNNRGHFMVGSMVVLPATILLWSRIITSKRNIVNVIILLVNLFHIIYIGQTRMIIFITLLTMLISFVFSIKKSRTFKLLIIIPLLICFILLEIQDIYSNFETLMGDNSVTYRLSGIDYYVKQLGDYPIFGMGFISTKNVELSHLLYGPDHIFYRTDVGFIGFINCFGILGGIWYIAILLYFIKLLMKKKPVNSLIYSYCFSIVLFIIFSSINLFPLDGFRIIYFPIIALLMNNLGKIEEEQFFSEEVLYGKE